MNGNDQKSGNDQKNGRADVGQTRLSPDRRQNKIKNEIQTIQNKCLKIILKQPTHTSSKMIHQTLKCEKLDKRFSILTCNFLTNARINNPSFKQIFEDHLSKDVNCTKSKRSILDRINSITLTPQLSTTQYF